MLETYQAKLRGNRIRWIGEAPAPVDSDTDIDVIVVVADNQSTENALRPYGLAKDQFVVPHDFDDPLPDEILAEFEN